MNDLGKLIPEKLKGFFDVFWVNYQEKILIIFLALIGIFILYILLKFLIKRVIVFSIGIKEKLGNKLIPIERVKTLNSVFDSILKLFVLVAICLVFLKVFDIKLLPIIAGAGFLGAAIIVLFQDMLKDIFKGWLLIFDDQYRKGEWVLINNNFQGEVSDLSLRRTTLRDKNGNLHMIPNSSITFVSNISRSPKIFSLKLWVDSKKDPRDFKQKTEEAIKEFVNNQPTDMKPLGLRISGLEKIATEEYLIEIKFKAYYPKGEVILESLRNFIFEKNKKLKLEVIKEE